MPQSVQIFCLPDFKRLYYAGISDDAADKYIEFFEPFWSFFWICVDNTYTNLYGSVFIYDMLCNTNYIIVEIFKAFGTACCNNIILYIVNASVNHENDWMGQLYRWIFIYTRFCTSADIRAVKNNKNDKNDKKQRLNKKNKLSNRNSENVWMLDSEISVW